MSQINRSGIVRITDNTLAVWEDPGFAVIGKQGDLWQRQFKREVFARIVQTLNRLGWTVELHAEYLKRYGRRFSLNHRLCAKGHLRAELDLSGRCIRLEFWQGVNTPTRPDNGGRYERIEAMPYAIRLEMERARNRITRYLCNVFTDYRVEDVRTPRPLQVTAVEQIHAQYQLSWHFTGDWTDYVAKGQASAYNRKSADGALLEHGQRVWLRDYRGRWLRGTAYYNINNMWWVALDRYAYTNRACFELHTVPPADPRRKDNRDRAIGTLRKLLAAAITAAEFERAALYRDELAKHGFDCRPKPQQVAA